MTRRPSSFLPAVFLLACALLLLSPAANGLDAPDGHGFRAGIERTQRMLGRWRVDEALGAAHTALVLASGPDEEYIARVMLAKAAFYKGDYALALEHARLAAPGPGGPDPGLASQLRFIASTSARAEGAMSSETPGFAFRYWNPKDAVLIPYAARALGGAVREIAAAVGYERPGTVVVEIYPTLPHFAAASTLAEADIRRTGVVGICKFDRIMVLSPRLIPKGYPWLDTLAHEYTHFVVFKASENTVPVWMHEGIAKYFEKRWTGRSPRLLTPSAESTLAHALESGTLVPMESMFPSFGKLGSAHEAMLAFLQVGTMVEYFVSRWGEAGLRELLADAARDGDFEAAFAGVTGGGRPEFERQWKGFMDSAGLEKGVFHGRAAELVINEGDGGEAPGELTGLEDRGAKGYAKLGDLMRARGRVTAAAYEYEKALELEPGSPVLANRLATARSALNDHRFVVELLLPYAEGYPGYVDTFVNLGVSYVYLGEPQKAREALERAVGINPFDPGVHSELIGVYESLGMTEGVERETQALSAILGLTLGLTGTTRDATGE